MVAFKKNVSLINPGGKMNRVPFLVSMMFVAVVVMITGGKNDSGAFEWTPCHVGISVADIDASINWYSSILGFELLKRNYTPQLKSKVAFMGRNGFEVELFEPDNGNPLPTDRRIPNLDIQTHGMKHFALSVNDLHAVMNELKAKKVDVAMDIIVMEGERVAFIRDPTGNLIELFQKNSI